MDRDTNKYPFVFDAHCHIYPDRIAQKAAEAIGAFYSIPMSFDGSVGTLLSQGGKAGVNGYLVHSVATSPKQVASINSFIADQVALHPKKFIGFGALHPHSETPEKDVEHILSLGLKGVKLHPDVQKFEVDSPETIALCSIFAGKLPLLVHAGDHRYSFSNPHRIRALCERLPDLTVIAAHFGGWSEWEEAEKLLPGLPNLYVDTSSSLPFLSAAKAKELIDAFGRTRVLFGVDYPMWDHAEELERFFAVDLDDEARNRILYRNAFDLLGLDMSDFE